MKVHYRCSQVKLRGKQFGVAVYLYYPNDSDKITIFRTTNEHNHKNLETHKTLPKAKIEELTNLKLK
ncbi:unnamed protein product [Adineta steineri]|uniref:Uncharacterized protein n=1 Tax=Adineta steineri TaxID=433720 RepID=A0A815GYE0_9BILA|nr:unnamed protein product [Adineta steineri]CAF1595242.1 unnamed protein product [Adineta steineri]